MNESLIIGANGLVGRHLKSALGDTAIGTGLLQPNPGINLDIRYKWQFEDFSKQFDGFKTVYLAAAETHVDKCEWFKGTRLTNVTGVINTVDYANTIGAKLVFFSSDYVFDGAAGPYTERDVICPINEYGGQKVQAEHFIMANSNDYLIIRTSWVFGIEKAYKNFVYQVLRKKQIKASLDQIGSPTYVEDLAAKTIKLVELNKSGIFHIAGSERVSRYKFARDIVREFELDDECIIGISDKGLNVINESVTIKRPLNSGLDSSKTESTVGEKVMSYKTGLAIMNGKLQRWPL